MRDGAFISEEDCPLVYKAIDDKRPINYPRDDVTDSILIYPILKRGVRFIFSLFGKEKQICFDTEDFKLISALSEAAVGSLFLSSFLENRINQVHNSDDDLHNLRIIASTINEISEGDDLTLVVKEASNKIFGSTNLLVSVFDGSSMKYLPQDIKMHAEKCASGLSYTFREIIVAQNNPDDRRFNTSLYKSLQIECEKVVAFPFRVFGRIAGAIELIDPDVEDVSTEMQLF